MEEKEEEMTIDNILTCLVTPQVKRYCSSIQPCFEVRRFRIERPLNLGICILPFLLPSFLPSAFLTRFEIRPGGRRNRPPLRRRGSLSASRHPLGPLAPRPRPLRPRLRRRRRPRARFHHIRTGRLSREGAFIDCLAISLDH